MEETEARILDTRNQIATLQEKSSLVQSELGE